MSNTVVERIDLYQFECEKCRKPASSKFILIALEGVCRKCLRKPKVDPNQLSFLPVTQ